MARPVIIDTDPDGFDALASAVAAVSVRRIGARASYADRGEVEAFIADRG